MNNDTSQEREQAWTRAVRDALEREAAALDVPTAARLRAARLRALHVRPQPGAWLGWPALAGASVVLVLAVGIFRLQTAPLSPTVSEAAEVMSSVDEGFDLYENLEFYEWLEAQGDEDKRNG